MAFWRKLAAKLAPKSEPADNAEKPTWLIYILLPEPLQPFDRAARYEDALEAELGLAGLGCVSGGGSQLSEEKPDGTRDILFCGIDVDTYDVDAARALLRLHLPELGCPAGTQLQFRDDADVPLLDEFDGAEWRLELPSRIP
ncbi:MAG TPA: hypothetical protein VGW40_05020 [Allosphingosinicella sp.]|nr:hypothetical protein [Allosphingosinicella sp.]